MYNLKSILTIAGTDPTGGAGITADIRSANSLGVHSLLAVTAVTAQSSHGIEDIMYVSPEILEAQLSAIIKDCIPDAVKIGMIGNRENAFIIRKFISRLDNKTPVIVDPVAKASSGGLLNSNGSEDVDFRKEFINSIAPLCRVIITPNEIEWKEIYNIDPYNFKAIEKIFLTNGIYAIVITGIENDNERITDILLYQEEQNNKKNDEKKIKSLSLTSEKINSINLHGTGCTFSSLLASSIASGLSIVPSFRKANKLIKKFISRSNDYRLGNSSYGPLNINGYTLKE